MSDYCYVGRGDMCGTGATSIPRDQCVQRPGTVEKAREVAAQAEEWAAIQARAIAILDERAKVQREANIRNAIPKPRDMRQSGVRPVIDVKALAAADDDHDADEDWRGEP